MKTVKAVMSARLGVGQETDGVMSGREDDRTRCEVVYALALQLWCGFGLP